MVRAVIDAGADGGMPTCTYLLSAMGFALVSVTTGLVIAVKVAWSERMARITDREAIRDKVDDERTARDATRAMRERKGGTP